MTFFKNKFSNFNKEREIYLPDLLETSFIKSDRVFLDRQTIVEHTTKYEPVLSQLLKTDQKVETSRIIQAYIHEDVPKKLLDLQIRYDDITWTTKPRIFDHFIVDTANNTIANNKIAFDHLQKIVNSIETPIDFSKKVEGLVNKKIFNKETHEGIVFVIKNVSQFIETREYLEITDRSFVFLKNFLSNLDFSFLSKICFLNEKLVAIILIPHLMNCLKERQWGHVLALSFYTGKISSFINSLVAKTCTITKTLYGHYSPTIKTKFIGVAGMVSVIAIKTNMFNLLYPSSSILVKQLSLHKGFSGISGDVVSVLRIEGSKCVYEFARTLSAYSNAALAGFLEPKKEVLEHLLKNLPKK